MTEKELLMRLNAEHIVRQNVERENAKLRELVRTIYMCSNIRCNECEYDKYGQSNICTFDAEAELRELGVEV